MPNNTTAEIRMAPALAQTRLCSETGLARDSGRVTRSADGRAVVAAVSVGFLRDLLMHNQNCP